MIHEEDAAAVDEATSVVEEEDDFGAVYGDAPPVDDYRLATRPGVVSGGP